MGPIAGPKPGIHAGSVAQKVGDLGFTGPLSRIDIDVAAAAAGDGRAFTAIYNRYSSRLYDFCVGMLRDPDAAADAVQDTFCTAATRLNQLREPDKLRPWLYAIARHEALRRLRARKREHVVDEVPDYASPAAGPDVLAARTELATLVADAAGGLSDRDRTVLELHYRHGLDGTELADALGVSHSNANNLVGRLRTTLERSLGALLVARRARSHPGTCAELDAVLHGWDGQFSVLMRKRIARHLDHCPGCDAARHELVSPKALLASAPMAVPAPFWLRDHVLNQAVPHLHGAAGAGTASAGGASWWPTAKTGALTHGLHATHIAVAAPLLAAAVAIPVLVVGVTLGEPTTVAATVPPSSVAPAPPSIPRFGLDTPTTDRAPGSTRTVSSPVAPPGPVGPRPGPGLPGFPTVRPSGGPQAPIPGRPGGSTTPTPTPTLTPTTAQPTKPTDPRTSTPSTTTPR